MARNGLGTYVLPAGQPVVTNTTISSTTFNTCMTDIASALTQSLSIDGQTPMTAILPMGANKISNVGAATLATDVPQYQQLTNGLTNVQNAIPGRNMVYNGSMRVAQRGTAYVLTTSTAYGSLDGWAASMSGTAAGGLNQLAVTGTTRAYVAQLGRAAASAQTGVISMSQAFDADTSISAQGQTIIFSFVAKSGANFSAASNAVGYKIWSGTGNNQTNANMVAGSWTGSATPVSGTQVLTTSYTRYYFSASIPTGVTQLGVQFFYTPVGTAGADDNVYIGDVQVEVARNGATTPSIFEYLPYPLELLRCQYYFQTINGNNGNYIATGAFISTSQASIFCRLTTSMRVAPSAAVIGSAGGFSLSDYTSSNTTVTAISASAGAVTPNSINFDISGTGTPYTANRPAIIVKTATSGYIALISEL